MHVEKEVLHIVFGRCQDALLTLCDKEYTEKKQYYNVVPLTDLPMAVNLVF